MRGSHGAVSHMTPQRFRQLCFNLGLMSATWMFSSNREARAENSVAYKYEDYREKDGRIAIETHGVQLNQDLTPDLHLKLGGIIDTITGATPTGAPITDGSSTVPTSEMHDRRKAWDVSLAQQIKRVNVAVGYANSRESDYVSNGVSVNTLTDFNDKNTTLLLGFAGADDDVKVFYQSDWRKKQSRELIAGVTQLIDPLTSVTVNLSWGRATGYLSDPYKLVLKDTEVTPGLSLPLTYGENRPESREKTAWFTSINRSVPGLHGAAEASYRYYRDTFGTEAHTVELAWFQKVGEKLVLAPNLRFYRQTAADFYYYNLNATSLSPSATPNPAGPFYSSDYRLSALETRTFGLKAIWKINDRLELDVAYDRYQMRGRDAVTPRSAYPDADIVTAGLKHTW